MEALPRLMWDEAGQDVVEHGLIIAAVAIMVLVATTAFGAQVQAWFGALAGRITTTGSREIADARFPEGVRDIILHRRPMSDCDDLARAWHSSRARRCARSPWTRLLDYQSLQGGSNSPRMRPLTARRANNWSSPASAAASTTRVYSSASVSRLPRTQPSLVSWSATSCRR